MTSIQLLRRMVFVLVVCLFYSITGTGIASGQDDTAKTELGLRQRLIQMKMVEVEKKFRSIAERLRVDKPEQAKLLTEAYQQSKEGLITNKMAQATSLLNQNRLDEARKLHLEVRDGLDQLVRLLTQRKEPTISKQKEIDQLEQWKSDIEEQLRQQRQQTSETHKASNKEQTVEKLKAQIKDLDELAKKQQELMEATKENKKSSLRELDAIADRQFDIRKQTERLKNEIQKLGGEDTEGLSSDSNQKPSDEDAGKSGESGQPGDQMDKEASPSGDSISDQKSDGEKSDGEKSDGEKPDGEKPDGEKSDGEKSNGQKSSGQKSDGKPGGKSGQPGQQAPQPGQEALEQAQKEQAKAEEKLGSAKPEDAAKNQAEAVKKINEAKAEVEKEKRRIESLPEEVFDKLADDQRRLRDKAMEVAAKMEAAKKSDLDTNQEQSSQQDQSNPGEQSMKEAGEAQQQAADAIKNDDSDKAQEKQQQAERKMRKAIDEIEERLAQLKDETREEKLARLESRFKEMLDRQRSTSQVTVEIQDRRSVLDGLQHRDQIVLMRLANDEDEINESAQQAYDLLLEDGTSVVFPEVVADLQDQLTNAMNLLSDEKTGAYTQLVQKEIEATMEDLVDALKEAKDDKDKKDQNNESGDNENSGEQPDPPLLKKSAELKVLRLQQLRLNRRTENIEKLKGQPGVDDEVVSKEIETAARLQQKLVEMTDQILE